MYHKKVTSIKIVSDDILYKKVPSLMVLLDSVHEQAAQILLNHAELPMIMWNMNN